MQGVVLQIKQYQIVFAVTRVTMMLVLGGNMNYYIQQWNS